MNISKARELLKNNISPNLFTHSMGVEETALRLAAAYGVDGEKVSFSGLMHDYGKIFSNDILHRIAMENALVDDLTLQEPALLHAPVGAWLLKRDLGIDDGEILEAVRMHTTGVAGMSLLARIVYLADYIEPGRTCPGVKDIREIAFSDLDRAFLGAVNLTIKYVLEREKIVHPNSISFRNSLVLSLRKNNQELQGYEAY